MIIINYLYIIATNGLTPNNPSHVLLEWEKIANSQESADIATSSTVSFQACLRL